jgi:lysophospholipase L1-like esterase
LLLAAVLPAAYAQATKDSHWTGSWASSQLYAGPSNEVDMEGFSDVTLRQFVHLSIGGSEVRVHISNAFGITPLRISSVYLAKPISVANCKIDASTNKPLTFSGSSAVTIPPGAEYLSDPVHYEVAPLSDLAISFYLAAPSVRQTEHPGSRTTSCIGQRDVVANADMWRAKKVERWYYIAGVDVQASKDAGSIVALGDSITDGHATTTNGNDRWPDTLARRLQSQPGTARWGVLNQGIGGNHLLTDGSGQNVLARFDRDVLAQTGVRYVIVLEGVNDLGGLTRNGAVSPAEHEEFVDRLLSAYEQVIARAHAHGIQVIGATILPYSGSDYYHPDAVNEADRIAVNRWIRTPGHFDAVVDLDKVIADPNHPDRMLPEYDSGDHLHPGPKGYQAMGDAFPASLFQ